MLPKELIDWLEANAEVHDLEAAAAPEQIEPIPCSKFSDLCEALRDDGFILSPEGEDVFAIMLATHLSTTLPGPPLWVYLIGAPSAGKTTYLSFVQSPFTKKLFPCFKLIFLDLSISWWGCCFAKLGQRFLDRSV